MNKHNEFLITCYVNDGDTGELIEKVRIILVDDDDEFRKPKDVDRHIKKYHGELCELAESLCEYESEDGDVYRFDWVYLENETDDNDDDDADEYNSNGDGIRSCWTHCRTV